jgi:outer membrane protein assembly factor BamB
VAPAPTKVAPASAKAVPAAPKETSAATDIGPDWPGFRGPHRDGIIPGLRIATDWSVTPPVELWRRPIGPGWSSFAVHGGLIYTQEQRGNDEVVSCYNAATGKPVWIHKDAARFYESNGGPGPRGTPTISNGRVYALGATGILKALDAGTGAVVWSRNAASDTKTKVPGWGFSGSPLVADNLVIVAVQGKLAAYELATGNPRWTGPAGGDGYSSPHLMTMDGVSQVLLMSGHGAISVAPADGKVLWQYPWKTGTRIVQPALVSDSDLLMVAGEGMGGTGMRRVTVAHGPGGWTTQERWTSNMFKPNFNDFVVHKGHVYGFDGSIMACIDLKDGTRKWKGGRYGAGQLLLLADQDLLLVLAEEGDLALVSATTEQFKELARIPGIEGKVWSHPALAGDELFFRNGQEMAAFRLSLAR